MAKSLPELLLAAAAADPERPFLRFAGRTLSRAQVADAVVRTAGWLTRKGLAGHRVALLLENRPEFLEAWLGAGLAGAVTVPLDPDLRADELSTRLRVVRPSAVIVERSALPRILSLRAVLPSLRQVIVVGDAPDGTIPWSALVEGPATRPVALDPDAATEIVYTAGATGRPRGVIWRHGRLAGAGDAFARLLGLGGADQLMIVLPLFTANAQFSVAMALGVGASILLERRFHAPSFWTTARAGGATQVSLSGSLVSRLYSQRARRSDGGHSIGRVLSVGTPKELHEAFENRFGVSVIEAFGLTEAGYVTVNPVERGRRKLGTVGLPVPWCEVAVLDENMRPLAAGATGEICIRPRRALPRLSNGYLEEEADGKASSGRWVRSGDIGMSDDEGFFTFLGHREDVVRRRGKAISTSSIENALLRHPAVSDAAVIGLPDGEMLAVVVLRAPVAFEELARFCRDWLHGNAVPSCFKAVEHVPKTASGRIRKSELRNRAGIFDNLHRVSGRDER
ncbi:MAG: AMP-binding protein [Myxococcales bacterium]